MTSRRLLKGSVVTAFVAGLAYYFVPDSLYKSFPQVVISDQEKMSVASKIAANVIKMAPAGPEATFGDLWQNQSCVVVFLRRFG